MPTTRKELATMLIEAFESIGDVVDSPVTIPFKGFNQYSVQNYLNEWLRMSQREDASLRMAASYNHSEFIIQVWFYHNDYHNYYYEDESESVIGISNELSDDDKDSEGSGEE